MKNVIFATFVFLFFSCSSSKVSDDDKLKVKNFLTSEPSILDHTLTDVNVLYVAVINDGAHGDTYAQYLCEKLKENSIQVERVKVVEYGTMKSDKSDNAYGVLLGTSFCK